MVDLASRLIFFVFYFYQAYVELQELVMDSNNDMHWMEAARWIKNEEGFQEDLKQWGKPQLSYLTFRSLLELRQTVKNGTFFQML